MTIINSKNNKIENFDIRPENSRSLPGHYYFDEEILAREMPAIFYRSWQYAGHVSMLAKPRDYIVRDIGDQSVIILRDSNGELRGFHNVCQHRAHRLLEGEGRIKALITCPYHAWSYDMSGDLKRVPGEENALGLDTHGICLKSVQVEQFLGFVFYNLDATAESLAAQTGGEMEKEFRSFCPDPESLNRCYTKTYDVKANWKNVIENYSECYHCPTSHPTLAQNALDMSDYKITVNKAYHHHNSGNRGDMQGYDFDPGSAPRASEFGGWYIFPSVVFEFYPGGKLTVFHNVPAAPEETTQNIEWYLAGNQATEEEQAIIDFVDVVRREDFPLVESVQRGLHSQGYTQGRFLIDKEHSYLSEHAVHDFQLRVLRALGDFEA